MSRTKRMKPGSGPNPRSRAYKRDTSPSINTDKSLKNAPRPIDTAPILSARTNAGVSKSKRGRPKSRNQRLRTERGMARAEAVLDHLEKKVEGSKKKERRRNARRSTWDEVNGTGKEERRNAVLDPDAGMDEDDNEWEDQDEEEPNAIDQEESHVDKTAPDVTENLATATKTKLVITNDAMDSERTDEADKIT